MSRSYVGLGANFERDGLREARELSLSYHLCAIPTNKTASSTRAPLLRGSRVPRGVLRRRDFGHLPRVARGVVGRGAAGWCGEYTHFRHVRADGQLLHTATRAAPWRRRRGRVGGGGARSGARLTVAGYRNPPGSQLGALRRGALPRLLCKSGASAGGRRAGRLTVATPSDSTIPWPSRRTHSSAARRRRGRSDGSSPGLQLHDRRLTMC